MLFYTKKSDSDKYWMSGGRREGHLEGLGKVEDAASGHVGPQQLLQKEIRQHVAALISVVFLQ